MDFDRKMYAENPFYRDMVDKALQRERERNRMMQELVHRQAMLYTRQLPYQNMVRTSQSTWNSSYPVMENNFVNYWQAQTCNQSIAQQQQLRSIFKAAVTISAMALKNTSPAASIALDGIGILMADNVFEATHSALSLLETAADTKKTD